MPRYAYRDVQGRQFLVDSPRPLTDEEQAEAAAQAFPPTAEAPPPSPRLYLPPQTPLPPRPSATSIPEALWEGTKTVLGSGLELAGRPGEAAAGFVGGTLQGGLGKGLERGWRGLTSNAAEESFGKVLEEQQVLEKHPWLRAGTGFLLDVMLDPTNLLGGAGMLRRGVMAGAAKAGSLVGKADEARQLARVATAVPLGEAFQSTVAQPVGRKLTQVAAKTPGLQKFFLHPELEQLTFKGENLSAADAQRVSDSRLRVIKDAVRTKVNTILGGVSPADRELLAYGIGDPLSAEGRQLAGRSDLTDVADTIRQTLDTVYQADVQAQLINSRLPVTLGRMQPLVDSLADSQRQAVETFFQNPADPKAAAKIANSRKLRNLVTQLQARIKTQSVDQNRLVDLYDPASLRFTLDPATKQWGVSFSSKGANYMPTYAPPTPSERPASIFREFRPELKEAEQKMRSFNVAGQAGEAITDVGEILTRRLVNSARAQEGLRLLDRYATEFGATVPAVGTKQLPAEVLKSLPEPVAQRFTNVYLPDAVADELAKFTVRLNDPKEMEGVISRGFKVFKGMTTSLNIPSYHITNFIGNVSNMYASGMDPDQIFNGYVKSTLAIQGKNVYAPVKLATPLTVGGTTISQLNQDELLGLARQLGIIGESSGYVAEFAKRDKQLTRTAKALTSVGPLNPENVVFTKARAISQAYVEDPAKLALFVDELKKGRSIEEAAIRVKDVLFDYNELSDFEKKYVSPATLFYTFTRKNIPLQLANLGARPSRLANQERLLTLADRIAAAEEDVQPLKPDELPESFSQGGEFRLPFISEPDAQGVKRPVLGRARLPIYDVNFGRRVMDDPLGVASTYANPAISMIAELGSGREYREGMPSLPIYSGISRATPVGRALGAVIPGLVAETPEGPKMRNLPRYLTNQVPVPAAIRALTNPPQPDSAMNPLAAGIYRGLGLGGTQITPEVYRRGRQENAADRKAQKRREREVQRWQRLLRATP